MVDCGLHMILDGEEDGQGAGPKGGGEAQEGDGGKKKAKDEEGDPTPSTASLSCFTTPPFLFFLSLLLFSFAASPHPSASFGSISGFTPTGLTKALAL